MHLPACAAGLDGPAQKTHYSGLKTGAVTLALADMGQQATDEQMQQGTASDPMLMSPADVKSTIAIARVERSANVQLTGAEIGKWFALSGAFTQTFLAPAVLGPGWWCYLQNCGEGDITIPSSDGRTNWIMYPGEMRLFQCNGTELSSAVLNSFCKEFTSSASFIKPPGYANFSFFLWSGGGSGAVGSEGLASVTGGAGAACAYDVISESNLAEVEPVVIGAGGAGKVGVGNGNAGGSSSFAGVTPAPGGGGFSAVSNAAGGAEGKTATPLGVITFPGSTRGSQATTSPSTSDSIVHRGGGAGANIWVGSTSGVGRSLMGGDGSNAVSETSATEVLGIEPQAPGGGSGAVRNAGSGSARSANGARGELRIWGVR